MSSDLNQAEALTDVLKEMYGDMKWSCETLSLNTFSLDLYKLFSLSCNEKYIATFKCVAHCFMKFLGIIEISLIHSSLIVLNICDTLIILVIVW